MLQADKLKKQQQKNKKNFFPFSKKNEKKIRIKKCEGIKKYEWPIIKIVTGI